MDDREAIPAGGWDAFQERLLKAVDEKMGGEETMGDKCEIRDFDGSDATGKACERPVVGKDARGRHCCQRHLTKIPAHVRERREREAREGK